MQYRQNPVHILLSDKLLPSSYQTVAKSNELARQGYLYLNRSFFLDMVLKR